MDDIICPECKDPINEHNARNGCSHVRRSHLTHNEQATDVVCTCWMSPQDIASARLEAIEAAAREVVQVCAEYTPSTYSPSAQAIALDKLAALLEKAGAK